MTVSQGYNPLSRFNFCILSYRCCLPPFSFAAAHCQIDPASSSLVPRPIPIACRSEVPPATTTTPSRRGGGGVGGRRGSRKGRAGRGGRGRQQQLPVPTPPPPPASWIPLMLPAASFTRTLDAAEDEAFSDERTRSLMPWLHQLSRSRVHRFLVRCFPPLQKINMLMPSDPQTMDDRYLVNPSFLFSVQYAACVSQTDLRRYFPLTHREADCRRCRCRQHRFHLTITV